MPNDSQAHRELLVVNGGSSSLKFALFQAGERPVCIRSGKFDRIGLPDGTLTAVDHTTAERTRQPLKLENHAACISLLVDLLESGRCPVRIEAVGHRVVHGGNIYYAPEKVTEEVLVQLRRLSPFAPAHMPAQIGLIEAFARQYPDLAQIACFDTAFHRDLPRVAKLLPIPRRYDAAGVQRYGFHGLSYSYLMQELRRVAGPAAEGRVILAHLGNGASMAAVREGRSIDTTMAFTPAAGMVMSTRSGDLDPGVVEYLARTENIDARAFYEMVHAKSGLLGVSETSSDLRDLLEREATDVRAAEAIALFCYHARKWIGALTAALGGLDTLVFAGGIGENSAEIRTRICAGFEYLGIRIDPVHNQAAAPVITTEDSPTAVRVIPTDEEAFMARCVMDFLRLGSPI